MDNKDIMAYYLVMAYQLIQNNFSIEDAVKAYNLDESATAMLKVYTDKIESYRRGDNNSLTIDEQHSLYTKLGIDCLDKIRINDINSQLNQNGNSKAIQYTKKTNQQFGNYDEAAFSDIYMFGFLVLLFQVLFLVISYMIFSK